MDTSKPSLKIVIACGGTGGHLFPGIAVAQRAEARGHSCLVLISEKEIDALASKGHQDLKFAKLPAVAMPRLLSLQMPKFLVRLWKSYGNCRQILKEHGADAVLGMGGFTSLAPLFAGRRMKRVTLLHESNAFAGKANRLCAKFCDLILLGMQAAAVFFPGRKTAVVGTPLRESLSKAPSRDEALGFFGLSLSKRTLLVIGGSQGARGVNENILKALPLLDEEKLQVIHLTGPNELETVKKAYAAQPSVQAHVAPFCQQMEMAYAAADAAVSRSGASSLTELSAFGVPTLLIPYPFAANDHQTCNAKVYVDAGAAEMIQERDLSPDKLAELLAMLLTDDQKRDALRSGMLKLSPTGAADAICDAIEALCRR